MSGSSLAPWALSKNALTAAIDVGKEVRCPVNKTDRLVTCLKEMNVNTLLRAAKKIGKGTKVRKPRRVFHTVCLVLHK